MPSFTAEPEWDERPWGYMRVLNDADHDMTVKYLYVRPLHRTSLQYHERKDEYLLIVDGDGRVEVDDRTYEGPGHYVHIPPGTKHRVTGPLAYLEISSYDDGTDTVRLEDDYGRA